MQSDTVGPFCGEKSQSLSGLSAAIHGVAGVFDCGIRGTPPQTAAKALPKYFSNIAPPFFLVNAAFLPKPFPCLRTVFWFFPLPSVSHAVPPQFILWKMTVDFIPLKLYVVKVP